MAEATDPSSRHAILSAMALTNENAKRLGTLHSTLFDTVKQFNQHWIERAQAEAVLAADLAFKVSSCKQLPDVTQAYWGWAAARAQRATDDVGYMVIIWQRLTQAGSGPSRGDNAASVST